MTKTKNQHNNTEAMSESDKITEKRQFRNDWKAFKQANKIHRGGNYSGGFFLIFLGINFLLVNFGLISPVFWRYLWQYWPLLIILFGIRILLGRGRVANIFAGGITLVVLCLVWVNVLIEINSPLLTMWGLNTLPWYNSLKQLPISSGVSYEFLRQ